MSDLISVIVPVYKVEAYLDCCIDSIVNQFYGNIEIILVDDGSPDRCPELCDDWAMRDSRIIVIHKKNGGLSDARNAGLKQAHGHYIAFVDSDDWIDQRYIDYLYLAIKRTGAELAACDFAVVPDGEGFSRSNGQRLLVESASSYDAINDLTSGVRFRAVAWNKLYLADILKNEQFEYGRIHEDEFFTYRIIDKAQKLVYVDIPLYCYRQRECSIMSSFSAKHIDAIDAFYERACYFAEKYPDIARKDKLTTCIACINMYCEIESKGCKESDAAKKRIKDIRRKLHFTKDDWKAYSSKQKMYLILSTRWFIGLFARIKYLKGKRDGDDAIEPEMYERLLANAYKHQADISHCGYQMVFPSRVDYYYNTGRLVQQDKITGLKDLLSGEFIEPGLWNILFRKSLFYSLLDDGLMDMSIKNNEDLLMNYYLFREASKSVYDDFCPYHYMVRNGSAATSQMNEHKLRDPLRVLKIIQKDTEQCPDVQLVVNKRIAVLLVNLSTMPAGMQKELIEPYRKAAREELRSMAVSVFGGGYSAKQKLQVAIVIVCPWLYSVIRTTYAKIRGTDKKYEVR